MASECSNNLNLSSKISYTLKLSNLTTVTFAKLAKLHLRYIGPFFQDKNVQETLTSVMEAMRICFTFLMKFAQGHGFLMCNILAHTWHNLNLLQGSLGGLWNMDSLLEITSRYPTKDYGYQDIVI